MNTSFSVIYVHVSLATEMHKTIQVSGLLIALGALAELGESSPQ